jgi:16S rRNA processing protein RimM
MEDRGVAEKLISIGQIIATHGNKGEVRVYPLTDFPNRFESLEKVYCQLNERLICLTINNVRYHKKHILLQFAEIDDMNKAESLKMGMLKIRQEDLMPLPEGHYYIFQLIGLKVFSTQGDFLGTIYDIQKTGSNDVYYVRHPETGKEVLIPAIKQFVSEINLAEKRILVKLLPGLID